MSRTRATPLALRRRLLGGAAALSASVTVLPILALGTARAAGADAPDDAPASPEPPSTPLGSRIDWPRVRLLDGRLLEPVQAGGPASVVVFFSTTCPFCARHNVHVQKLLDTTRGQPLRVLGVAHDKQPEAVQRYLARRGLGFDVSLDQGPLHAALSRKPGIPLTCVVDRQQRLREVIRGEMFEEDVLGLARWATA
jgi:peroxiredoxin